MVVWYLVDVDGVNLVVNSDRRARDTLLLVPGCDQILLLLHLAKNFELLRQKGFCQHHHSHHAKKFEADGRTWQARLFLKNSEGGGLDWTG